MRRYSEFQPTGFDARGAFLPDRQDWFVVPVCQTRDSGPMDQSNFSAALKMLGGESETVEVHRFGHWGPGWFEIILAHPSIESAVEDIEASLENYPLLDETDFSEREEADYSEAWERYGHKDFARHLQREYGLSDRARYVLEDATVEQLREWFEQHVRFGEYHCCDSDGVYINFRGFDASRVELAAFLRSLRAVSA